MHFEGILPSTTIRTSPVSKAVCRLPYLPLPRACEHTLPSGTSSTPLDFLVGQQQQSQSDRRTEFNKGDTEGAPNPPPPSSYCCRLARRRHRLAHLHSFQVDVRKHFIREQRRERPGANKFQTHLRACNVLNARTGTPRGKHAAGQNVLWLLSFIKTLETAIEERLMILQMRDAAHIASKKIPDRQMTLKIHTPW